MGDHHIRLVIDGDTVVAISPAKGDKTATSKDQKPPVAAPLADKPDRDRSYAGPSNPLSGMNGDGSMAGGT